MPPPARRPATALALIAPFAFALIWASSYVTARIGLYDITPCAFVAIRLVIAAAGTLAFIRVFRRASTPPAAAWPHLMAGGALIHGVTLTTAHVALLTVKSAPLGLVHAFHPVLTAALGVFLLGETFTARQWLGMAVGLAGVALVLSFEAATPQALWLLGASLAGLTGGTLYLKRYCPGIPPFEATSVQLAGGALAAVVITALFESPQMNWTGALLATMGWNILVVSLLGMGLYTMMLTRDKAGRAASAFFIVPGAAALFAYVMLGETLSPVALAGLGVATFGVWLVWRKAG